MAIRTSNHTTHLRVFMDEKEGLVSQLKQRVDEKSHILICVSPSPCGLGVACTYINHEIKSGRTLWNKHIMAPPTFHASCTCKMKW